MAASSARRANAGWAEPRPGSNNIDFVVDDIRSDVDLSYLADSVLLLRFFEADGEVRKAISVVKTRTTDHERTIREFRVDKEGLNILTGVPTYRGAADPLMGAASAAAHALGEGGDGIER